MHITGVDQDDEGEVDKLPMIQRDAKGLCTDDTIESNAEGASEYDDQSYVGVSIAEDMEKHICRGEPYLMCLRRWLKI